MLHIENWNAEPEAMNLPVFRCVVCDKYCGPDDLLGVVAYHDRGEQTIPLAYHTGQCAQKIDHFASVGDGILLDIHIADRITQLENNTQTPPQAGQDGLLSRSDTTRTDMRTTLDFLNALNP